MSWPDAGEDRTSQWYVDFTGMPDRADLLEHYAKLSGRDVSEIDYYVILARFKMAIVLEGGHAQFVRGSRRLPGRLCGQHRSGIPRRRPVCRAVPQGRAAGRGARLERAGPRAALPETPAGAADDGGLSAAGQWYQFAGHRRQYDGSMCTLTAAGVPGPGTSRG